MQDKHITNNGNQITRNDRKKKKKIKRQSHGCGPAAFGKHQTREAQRMQAKVVRPEGTASGRKDSTKKKDIKNKMAHTISRKTLKKESRASLLK